MSILSTAPGIRLLSVELKEVEAQWAGAQVAPSRVFLPLSTQNTHGSTSQAPILGTTSLDSLQRESISFTSLHRTSLPSETETPQCRKGFAGLHTFHPGADHQVTGRVGLPSTEGCTNFRSQRSLLQMRELDQMPNTEPSSSSLCLCLISDLWAKHSGCCRSSPVVIQLIPCFYGHNANKEECTGLL